MEPRNRSPAGDLVLLEGSRPGAGNEILSYSFTENTIQEVLATRHNEGAARFSPDGHWFTYQSDESGKAEV